MLNIQTDTYVYECTLVVYTNKNHFKFQDHIKINHATSNKRNGIVDLKHTYAHTHIRTCCLENFHS